MSFWKMMRGTEPTFAGMRTPRQFVEDDARLTRLVNPQERYRSLQEIVPQGTRSSDSKDALEASAQDLMTTQERRDKLKGAVGGLGSILAGAFQQEPQRQLQFAPVNMGENVPIIDPRYMRYAGSRKKGGSVPVGSYVKVHDDEKVLNLGDGDVEVVPKGDEPKIQTPGGTIEVPIEETQESFKPPQKEDTSHSMGTPQEMEEPVKQSIADTLRGRIEEIQGRDYSKTKNEDGTTIYGKNYDRKRNWKDSLRSAGYGLLQSLATAPPTNDLGSLLGRAIGGAGTGAVLGATMDNVDEKMRDRLKLAQLMPQYEQAYGMERQKKIDDLQIENTRADNEINKLRIESVKQSKADAEVARALKTISGLKWFDPKNPTHAALAKVGKLDPTALQGWDDRRPYTKSVAGVEYVYKNGKFEPTNLPVNEAQTLKDYTVEMPNGEKRTYRVSQKDAANFSTQMSALGARIASNEKIAGLRTGSAERIAQLRNDAAMLRTQYQEAKKDGRAEDANKIRLKLKGILDEVDAFQGATGEAIIP